jgi:hypothetical protein
MLDKATGMRHIRRWSALALLAWSVHVPAFSAQVEMLPCHEVVQSMDDCRTCATCVLAPASVERTVERDDSPAALPSSWAMQLHQQVDINEATTGTTVRLPSRLRVLYCRWLN